jgi:hypothetical protein
MLFTLRARRPVASLMRGRIVTSLTVTAGTVFSLGLIHLDSNVVELSTTCKLEMNGWPKDRVLVGVGF